MNIGIDLGGTNIAAALVDSSGEILKRTSIRTNVSGGAKTVVNGLVSVCDLLLRNTTEQLSMIGIGVPGTVNAETGEVVFTPNLPLSRIHLANELAKKFGCAVKLGNDANCAALGEALVGGAKGAKDVVFITLGTGVGGGVIIGGKLITGVSGAACELGHTVIIAGGRKCGCGRQGCWETYASAEGIVRTAVEIIGGYKESLLWERCDGFAERLDGKAVFEVYRSGDEAAQIIVKKYVEHLGAGITNVVNALEPELICIGGGLSNAWDCLSEPLNKIVNAEKFYRFSPDAPQTKIVKAKLGNDAGIIGAASLAND
ncbi:MAG: ROK family glucokinase [Oscillospiraceae bacterium]|nr:ROK family glucokinase [Oscillospiraceae bacterium]